MLKCLHLNTVLCSMYSQLCFLFSLYLWVQDNAKTSGELTKALESTRAHLQGQLRSKEAENNRLAVQIKVSYGVLWSIINVRVGISPFS